MDDSFLQQLNDSQRRAVEYVDGASLVIAGAGSGKTRVLTYKIAYLLQNGYRPWNILALTFTNKAANEMKERIARLVGKETAQGLYMGTFHSVFSRILRVECESIGFMPNFTIYDESDSRSLIKSIVKEMNLDDKNYKPAAVHNVISLAKNNLITPDMYAIDGDALQRDNDARMPALHQVYSAYSERCRQANALDFDDLLLYTFVLFRDHEEIRRKYAERFQYVLVDEYQDTNTAQQRIVYQLTAEHQHVCVVGDDAQSIYAFRGANIDNILDFSQLYHNTQLFKLEQNYRSTQRIVQAANSLIKHNQWQISKDVFSENDKGDKLVYCPVSNDKVEAISVARQIKSLMRTENAGYEDFAILYRTNAQSRTFEEQLRKDGIPYRIYGGLSFYERKEIKDVIAYFRLVANPNDEEAFRRVVNYPARGIGATTVAKISETAHAHRTSLWQVIGAPDQYGLKVSKGTLTKLQAFHELIAAFIMESTTTDVLTLGQEIITASGLAKEMMADTSPEGLARKENLEEMMNSMQDFVDERRELDEADHVYLVDFLQEVSLYTDLDSKDSGEGGRVSLMTIHSAKGLEFPTVFVVGLEENIFPNPKTAASKRELEEERRLLYVAITRAERHCFLSRAVQRMRYGTMEFNAASRFLKDIDPRLITVKSETFDEGKPKTANRHWSNDAWMQNSRPVATQFKADPKPRAVPPRAPEKPVDPFGEGTKRLIQQGGRRLRRIDTLPTTPASAATPPPAVREGDLVEHTRFGRGRVLRVEGTGENTKATVDFEMTGEKQLLLKFARLKVIS